MRTYEEYINNPIPRTGRKRGSSISNKVSVVYRMLKRDGKTDITLSEFRKALDAVADVFWDKVYSGHQVAVPFLFNIEVIPAGSVFTPSINWPRTHKLWKEDRDAYEDRLLVRNTANRFKIKLRHSTISFNKRYWYLSLMMKIRLKKARVSAVEEKYLLR